MFKGWFKEMYFRELHTIFTEAFVEILIATFFTLQQNTRSPFGESVSYILAVFSALVICVQLPFSFFMITCHDKEILQEDEHFDQAYGKLYENLNIDTKAQRLFYLFYMARRIAFFSIAYFGYQWPVVFQISALLALSNSTLIYYILLQPQQSSTDYRVETFNEFAVGVMTLLSMTQSDWVLDPETAYFYGWVLVGCFQLLILLNMILIIKQSFNSFKQLYFKYLHQRLQKLMPVSPKKQPNQSILKIKVDRYDLHKFLGENQTASVPRRRNRVRFEIDNVSVDSGFQQHPNESSPRQANYQNSSVNKSDQNQNNLTFGVPQTRRLPPKSPKKKTKKSKKFSKKTLKRLREQLDYVKQNMVIVEDLEL